MWRQYSNNNNNKKEKFQQAFGLIPTMMLPYIQLVIINLICHMLWAQGLVGQPNDLFWASSVVSWKKHVFSHG